MKRISLLISGLAVSFLLATSPQASSQYALLAKQITLNGYDFFTDSYDSADPLWSTGGLYDPLKAGRDLGNVAAEAGIVNSVGGANVLIWGRLSTTAPYSLDIGPESSIGSTVWHGAGQVGIEPGFHDTSFLWQFPDPIVPFYAGVVPVEGIWEGEFYTYILDTDNYKLSSLNLSGGDKVLVRGSAALYVADELNLKGSAQIRILPSASLQLYVGATTANLRGTGILNEGGPTHFKYVGVPPNNTINLRLTTGFSGLIYAPRAVCYVTTKGGAAAELQGVIAVQELNLGAPFRLHYDEALAR